MLLILTCPALQPQSFTALFQDLDTTQDVMSNIGENTRKI